MRFLSFTNIPFISKTLALGICLLGCFIPSQADDSIENSLRQLDEIILNRESFESNARNEIDKALLDYKKSKSPEDQYGALRNLYNLYRTYKIDSAMIIADKRLEIARTIGDKSKIISATLNLAESYAKSGNTDFAISLLDTLSTAGMANNQLKYRNSVYQTAYANKVSNSLLPQERMEALSKLKKFRERELEEIEKGSRSYLVLQAQLLRNAGMYREAVEKMEEAMSKYNFEDNASLLYEAGETFLDAGMEDQALIMLSKAATLDFKAGSKEYKALILLASLLLKRGEINRSFNYINCALEDAMFSKANLRTDEIIRIMPGIYQAFSDKEREIKRRTAWFLGAIGILNLILIGLIILLVEEHNVKKRVIRQLNEMNARLDLYNKQLEESDKLKMEHLKKFMFAYANHLSSLRTFRKNLLRLLNSNQYRLAIEKVKAAKGEDSEEDGFHVLFDTVFLSLFPDFIQKLNKYFTHPSEIKNSDRLTPELRLIALMKLGVNSTREISEIFQYSPQSVYNLRSTIRSAINIPWEEFELKIKDF